MPAQDGSAVQTSDLLPVALERTNDAVVILDHDFRVSHCNAAAEALWGLDRAEILGRHASALGFKDLRQDGNSQLTIERLDGSRIRAALSLSHAGADAIAILRDVTPELELRERLALHVLIADGTNRAG